MARSFEEERQSQLCSTTCRCDQCPTYTNIATKHLKQEGQEDHEAVLVSVPPFRRRHGRECAAKHDRNIRWFLVITLHNKVFHTNVISIFELQARNFTSLITVTLLWPMLMLMTPFYYLHDPVYLFFTYLLPWVPFVVVFDGYISMLRTRTPDEVYALLKSRVPAAELAKWRFKSGEAQHTWPIGWLSWIICYKEE